MRATFTLILTVFFLKVTFAQSPFNYGQNKKVYFISTELRNKLSIDTIYTINEDDDSDLNDLWKNWSVTLISFDENSVTDDWYPISRDSSFKFNFDSLIANMEYLNGSRYEFSNGQLVSYGGGGYGTFDWKEIARYSDTISIIETSCVGHCGNNANIHHSKNVFNKKGQLLYSVNYPTLADETALNEEEGTNEEEVIFEEEGMYEEGMSFQEYEKILTCHVTSESIPDTLKYKYDSKGLLLNTSKENAIENIEEAKTLFTHSFEYATSNFHQCYVGKIEMEKFILKKLGYMPDLILIEVYKQAVFSFSFNPFDKKYYESRFIILEQ